MLMWVGGKVDFVVKIPVKSLNVKFNFEPFSFLWLFESFLIHINGWQNDVGVAEHPPYADGRRM